jgi:hypothetical protein
MLGVEATSKAVACLRVLIYSASGRPASAELNALVAKLINAFLETRWTWPRQFSAMTPYAFVLSDPRSQALDKQALRALSKELQLKLFGDSRGGEVSLLVFEGDEMEIHRFAGLEPDELERLLADGKADPPFAGRLNRLTEDGAQPVALKPAEPGWRAQSAKRLSMRTDPAYESVYRAQYFMPTGRFFGNIALCKPFGAVFQRDALAGPNVLPGVPSEAFDEACIASAGEAARSQVGGEGLLFVPLNFSSLVRPAARDVYARFFERLPAGCKDRLVATIYETPRDPSYFALVTIGTFLADHFSQINLQVTDPAFEIEKLAGGMVTGVTLVLSEQDGAARMAAIRRFMQQRALYKRKKIWPGISRVAHRAELDLCLAMRAPVVNGPAVSPLTPTPIGLVECDLETLPIQPSQLLDGPSQTAFGT